MAKVEEKVECQYCGKEFSKSGVANHEKACTENPENVVKEEKVEAEVVVDVAPEKMVKIKMKDSLECYIGNKYYRLKKGEEAEVPEEVKNRLKEAGMLEAL